MNDSEILDIIEGAIRTKQFRTCRTKAVAVLEAMRTVGIFRDPVNGQVPAIPISDTIHPDYVVCLEDGKRFKMLKGHLAAHHGLTPEQYREKWGLPDDHPMTAPNYSKKRLDMAHAMGLGHMRPKRGTAEATD